MLIQEEKPKSKILPGNMPVYGQQDESQSRFQSSSFYLTLESMNGLSLTMHAQAQRDEQLQERLKKQPKKA